MNLLQETKFLTDGYKHAEGYVVATELTCSIFTEILELTEAKSVFEIGFNYGHSAFTWLSLNDELKLASIDIGRYKHTHINATKLEEKFGDRFKFTAQNSRHAKPSDLVGYDLFWIDGDHSNHGLSADLNLGNAAESKYILIDDYCNGIKNTNLGVGRLITLVEHYLAKDDFPYTFVKVYNYDCNSGKNPMALLKRDDA